MKIAGLIILNILVMIGCKSTEMSTVKEDEKYQREPTTLALEIQVEKDGRSGDFEVLEIQMDTLDYAITPRPTDENLPEVFKAEVLNASNKVVFGSQYKTTFSEEGRNIVNLKFFCSLSHDAVRVKIYYRVSQGVWKQIESIEL